MWRQCLASQRRQQTWPKLQTEKCKPRLASSNHNEPSAHLLSDDIAELPPRSHLRLWKARLPGGGGKGAPHRRTLVGSPLRDLRRWRSWSGLRQRRTGRKAAVQYSGLLASSRSFSAKLSANRCIVGSRLIQLMPSSNPQRKPWKLALAAV